MKRLTLGTVNVGFTVIAATQFPNPKDNYLFTVLAYEMERKEYVIWTYNAQTGGFGNGSYFRNASSAHEYYVQMICTRCKDYFEGDLSPSE